MQNVARSNWPRQRDCGLWFTPQGGKSIITASSVRPDADAIPAESTFAMAVGAAVVAAGWFTIRRSKPIVCSGRSLNLVDAVGT